MTFVVRHDLFWISCSFSPSPHIDLPYHYILGYQAKQTEQWLSPWTKCVVGDCDPCAACALVYHAMGQLSRREWRLVLQPESGHGDRARICPHRGVHLLHSGNHPIWIVVVVSCSKIPCSTDRISTRQITGLLVHESARIRLVSLHVSILFRGCKMDVS